MIGSARRRHWRRIVAAASTAVAAVLCSIPGGGVAQAGPPAAANRAWGWGYNFDGELGRGTTVVGLNAAPFFRPSGVIQVAAGRLATYLLRYNGTVWATGHALLVGTNAGVQLTVAEPIPGLGKVKAIAGMDLGGLALLSNGTVKMWGLPGNGPTSVTPKLVPKLNKIIAIAGGDSAGYALRGDGTVWAWGLGFYGQLGNGATLDSVLPVQVSGLRNVIAIAAGGRAGGYALLKNGTVRSWGYNGDGELGDGTSYLGGSAVTVAVAMLKGVKALASGNSDGYALLGNGSVVAWGANFWGQFGNGTTTPSLIPHLNGVTGIQAIAAGGNTGYALTASGTVLSWGYGSEAQLGNGTQGAGVVSLSPVTVTGLKGVLRISGSDSDGYAITR